MVCFLFEKIILRMCLVSFVRLAVIYFCYLVAILFILCDSRQVTISYSFLTT